MKTYNFIVNTLDTDSLTIVKQNGGEFNKEEINNLTDDLNSLFPELINWEFEFYVPKMLVLKSKNYIIDYGNNKRKIKGSSLKDQKSSKKILQFKSDIIDLLLNEQNDEIINLYHKYVKETKEITDILPWSKKLTVTEKIFKCKGHESLDKEEKKLKGIRANETSVYDAIKHKSFQEGDKIWVYYNQNDGLTLADEFDGKYDRKSFLKNLFTSLQIFKLVIDTSPYLNYTLKRNQTILGELDK
jgi:hypothetical protein